MMAVLRWLMPIGAAVLFYEAAAQSDIIIGFIAFGVLRSWWKDLLDLHDPKKGVIIGRISRWALLGGICVQLLVATKAEEYIACAILFVFVLLWKIGKLPDVWHSIRRFWNKACEVELPKFCTEQHHDYNKPVVVCHAEDRPQNPKQELSDSRVDKYKAAAGQELAAFMAHDAEVRMSHEALMKRLSQLEGGC